MKIHHARSVGDHTGAGASAGGSGAADRFLQAAMKFQGQPYKWGGGHGGHSGVQPVDCSGLVSQAAKMAGMPGLTGNAATLQHKGQPVSMKDLKPGDLVFKGSPAHHVGIYLGNGKVLEASHHGTTVGVSSVKGFTSARRVFGSPASAGVAAAAQNGAPVGHIGGHSSGGRHHHSLRSGMGSSALRLPVAN